jgi:hypothetical protein
MCLNNHTAILKIGNSLFYGNNTSRTYAKGNMYPSIHAEMDVIFRSPLTRIQQCILCG